MFNRAAGLTEQLAIEKNFNAWERETWPMNRPRLPDLT
jgi:hypothetical protein